MLFSASFSLGYAVSCQTCIAGSRCPNRTMIVECPFDSSNGFTYSTDTGKLFQ